MDSRLRAGAFLKLNRLDVDGTAENIDPRGGDEFAIVVARVRKQPSPLFPHPSPQTRMFRVGFRPPPFVLCQLGLVGIQDDVAVERSPELTHDPVDAASHQAQSSKNANQRPKKFHVSRESWQPQKPRQPPGANHVA